MKLFLSLILLFVVGIGNCQAPKQTGFNLDTFTRVPDRFSDCGNGWYFLSKSDNNRKEFILITDYDDAIVYVNNKPLWLRVKNAGYTPGKYTVIIKDGANKPFGDEGWTMKSVITIKFGSKIIWQKTVVGFGGC
jgi:hypothetical protein